MRRSPPEPVHRTGFLPEPTADTPAMVEIGRGLRRMGFSLLATKGTAAALAAAGVEVRAVNKVMEGRPHIIDALKNDEVQLIFNTVEGATAIADSYHLRREALLSRTPYYTTVAGARASVEAIRAIQAGSLDVRPLQSYFKGLF